MEFTKTKVITEADLTKLWISKVEFDMKKQLITLSYKEESTDKGTAGRTFMQQLTDKDYTALLACLDQTKFKKYINDNKLWEQYDLDKGESPIPNDISLEE